MVAGGQRGVSRARRCARVRPYFTFPASLPPPPDHYDLALAQRYEYNLVNLIKKLRLEFNSPDALFVTASLGQTVMGSNATDGLILKAMLDVANATVHPEFAGTVAAVYTHPLSMGGASNSHYNGNAETYMNVGQGMGAAMVELLKGKKGKTRGGA